MTQQAPQQLTGITTIQATLELVSGLRPLRHSLREALPC